MIKVKYIPCLFEETCHELETHNMALPTVLTSFIRKYPEVQNDHAEGICVRVNGKRISPFQWKKIVLEDGDEVLIIHEVGAADIIGLLVIGFSSLTGITFSAGSAAVAGTIINVLSLVTVVASIASTIYSIATQPKQDRQGGLPNSPTYGWEGIHLITQQGSPVQVIYGVHLIPGTIIGRC
jgi:predicted phage tail protein